MMTLIDSWSSASIGLKRDGSTRNYLARLFMGTPTQVTAPEETPGVWVAYTMAQCHRGECSAS
jgi:hypothetical protein